MSDQLVADTSTSQHSQQTSMPPVAFETTISADERPQTHALDHAATGTSDHGCYELQFTKELGKINLNQFFPHFHIPVLFAILQLCSQKLLRYKEYWGGISPPFPLVQVMDIFETLKGKRHRSALILYSHSKTK